MFRKLLKQIFSISQRTTLPVLAGLLFVFVFTACDNPGITGAFNDAMEWVGTWGTAPQLVEPGNMPPAPGLTDNTLRQIVRVSIGGTYIRVKFSNEFSTSPVTMKEVHIALYAGETAILPGTDQILTFGGAQEVTMEAGGVAESDPLTFPLTPRSDVAITIFFGETSPDVTGHPGSRTTSYLVEGNQASAVEFPRLMRPRKPIHWYVIKGIDVMAPQSAAAISILGNSITDGRGSTNDMQNRWPDQLSVRLLANTATRDVAVLNMGIGGNEILDGGLGPTALDRFDRDVLQRTKVQWLIILEGINDIGTTEGTEALQQVAADLIAAYETMIDQAHAAGILVYGATILPFDGSFYMDAAREREAARQTVNEWIRTSGKFDAVIDFDLAMQDPDNPTWLIPEGDTGDHLHPNEIGYQMMADYVDLSLFE